MTLCRHDRGEGRKSTKALTPQNRLTRRQDCGGPVGQDWCSGGPVSGEKEVSFRPTPGATGPGWRVIQRHRTAEEDVETPAAAGAVPTTDRQPDPQL